jgi:putative oxidoreductase
MAQSKGSSFDAYSHALLRIMAGFVFSLHGYQKVFGLFGGLGHGRAASMLSILWIAGVIESILGPFIIVGLYTRPIAFLLCGEMAVAYFSQHARRGFWPISNGGELAVLYCFIFLFLASNGAGPFSLDRAIRKQD